MYSIVLFPCGSDRTRKKNHTNETLTRTNKIATNGRTKGRTKQSRREQINLTLYCHCRRLSHSHCFECNSSHTRQVFCRRSLVSRETNCSLIHRNDRAAMRDRPEPNGDLDFLLCMPNVPEIVFANFYVFGHNKHRCSYHN